MLDIFNKKNYNVNNKITDLIMTHALRLFPWIVLNRQLKGSGQV